MKTSKVKSKVYRFLRTRGDCPDGQVGGWGVLDRLCGAAAIDRDDRELGWGYDADVYTLRSDGEVEESRKKRGILRIYNLFSSIMEVAMSHDIYLKHKLVYLEEKFKSLMEEYGEMVYSGGVYLTRSEEARKLWSELTAVVEDMVDVETELENLCSTVKNKQ